jgi:hypothetical protein
MVMRGPRESPCTPADARNRLQQAEALVLVADLALLDDTAGGTTTPLLAPSVQLGRLMEVSRFDIRVEIHPSAHVRD